MGNSISNLHGFINARSAGIIGSSSLKYKRRKQRDHKRVTDKKKEIKRNAGTVGGENVKEETLVALRIGHATRVKRRDITPKQETAAKRRLQQR